MRRALSIAFESKQAGCQSECRTEWSYAYATANWCTTYRVLFVPPVRVVAPLFPLHPSTCRARHSCKGTGGVPEGGGIQKKKKQERGTCHREGDAALSYSCLLFFQRLVQRQDSTPHITPPRQRALKQRGPRISGHRSWSPSSSPSGSGSRPAKERGQGKG
jgi:hypothetical protein